MKTAEVLQSVAGAIAETASDANEPATSAPRAAPREEGALSSCSRATAGSAARSTRTSTRRRARVAREGRQRTSKCQFATLGKKGREYLDAAQRQRSRTDFPRDLRRPRPRQGAPGRATGSSRGSRRASSTRSTSSTTSSRAPSRSRSRSSACCRCPSRTATAAAGERDAHRTERHSLRAEPATRSSSASCRCTSRSALYRALLESQASFFGAQMTAMDAATRNAKDMIARLTLAVQPRAPGGDHQGADGDHRRRRGADRLSVASDQGRLRQKTSAPSESVCVHAAPP